MLCLIYLFITFSKVHGDPFGTKSPETAVFATCRVEGCILVGASTPHGIVGNEVHVPDVIVDDKRSARGRITPLPTVPCFAAPALFLFSPSMCRRITWRGTVARHVSAVAQRRARFYYLPSFVCCTLFWHLLVFFSVTRLPKNERKRWHRRRQRCMWFSFLQKLALARRSVIQTATLTFLPTSALIELT